MPQHDRRWTTWPVLTAVGVLACVFAYGRARIDTESAAGDSTSLKVALIQGTEDTILDSDAEAARQRSSETFMQYWRLTRDVCAKHDDIDLIVWPEGAFSGNVPLLVVRGRVPPPPDSYLDQAGVDKIIRERIELFAEKTRQSASEFNRATNEGRTFLIVGCDAVELNGNAQQVYNAALLIDPRGDVVERYDKMHRVVLGEYVPLGDRFPWLYDLLPIGRGLTPGNQPVMFDVHGVKVAPSICFEVTVPQLIRRQCRQLTAQGDRPDLLVNLTNDGWFWGSGILDLQLNCAIFRAIELRRPLLVAANTGLTASIDSNGTVRGTLPRRQEGVVVTSVAIHQRASFYERWGDWFAGLCLLVCLALAVSGCRDRWRKLKPVAPGKK